MPDIQLFELPESTDPQNLDILHMSNEAEPGNVDEKVTIPNLFRSIKNFNEVPVPVATDFIVGATLDGIGSPYKTNMQDLSDFLATLQPTLSGGDGIDLTLGVISADINATNLQITANQINTIQDLAPASAPVFGGMTVNLAGPTPFSVVSTSAGVSLAPMTEAQFDAILTPANGLLAWATDGDRFRVNKGTPGAPVYDELAYVSDAPATATVAIGECYFSGNAVETVIAAAGTPVLVAGTFVSGTNSNITNVGARLTNTSGQTLELFIVCEMAVSFNLVNGKIGGSIFKNGVTQLPNILPQISLDDTSPSFRSILLSGAVTLLAGEFIEPFVANVSSPASTANITVEQINFSTFTFGGTASGGGGSQTWNDTIIAGDGTATTTLGKLISVVSSDPALPPEFGLEYTGVPIGADIIGAYKCVSGGNVYSDIVTKADGGSPLTAAEIEFQSFGTAYMAYFSNPDTFAFQTKNTSFNVAQEDGVFTVQTVANANAVRIIQGPTVPDEQMNMQIPLTMEAGQYGVNYTLGTSLVPTTTYTAIYEDMFQSFNGTNVIAANSLEIGQTIVLNMLGDWILSDVGGGSISGLVNIRILIGGNILAFETNDLTYTPVGSFTGSWRATLKITYVGGNRVWASIDGTRETPAGPSGMLFSQTAGGFPHTAGTEWVFDPAQPHDIVVECRDGWDGGVSQTYIATNANILKYS